LNVEISNGEIWVTDSTCKDKLCIKEGAISKVGDTIIACRTGYLFPLKEIIRTLTQYPIKGTKRVVYLAALIAIGVVLNLIEPMQIFPLLPGAKLGLANISSLLAILLFGGMNGILVAAIRTVASVVIRGSLNWISFGTSFLVAFLRLL